MLSHDDNALITQVGPGTPMGELARRFWMPAILSEQLLEPNGDPVRVRLVGENFVAWRDAAGQIGFFDEYCMHRGSSLALGRCEGDGLRCLYHGWKYATDGRILETPNLTKSSIRDRMRAPIYPVREAGGMIWVYLGPKEKEPPFPHYPFMDLYNGVSPERLPIYHTTVDCNYLQTMEGTIDPSHANLLHVNTLGKRYANRSTQEEGDRERRPGTEMLGDDIEYIAEGDAPECEAEDTHFGVHGIAFLDAVTTDGHHMKFGRAHAWVMPFLSIPQKRACVFSVPIDDEHTTFFLPAHQVFPDKASRDAFLERGNAGPASNYDGYRYRYTEAERWGQDRSKMHESWTGIKGTVPEDFAVILSMGPIYDRSREHLVPADLLCVRMRRHMIQAVRDLQAGVEPFMMTPEETITLGSTWGLLDDVTKWREEMVPGHLPFIESTREVAEVAPAQ